MEKKNIQVVRLSDYESIQQIMEAAHDELEGKPNGVAILFDSAPTSNIGIQTGLLRIAVENYASKIQSMEVIREYSDTGLIDGDLKDFIYRYMGIMTHILNSCSVRPNGSNMKEFEGFDRMELKMQLQTLIDRL